MEESEAPPVCPRHPDRVSHVRCQRCERPACPDCQTPAAVGVWCVDCVKDASRTAPRARTRMGAPHSNDTRPLVTYTLIGACVLVYLGQLSSSQVTDDFFYSPLWGRDEPWRMITAAFLHSPHQVFHLIMNMLALWMLGQFLEPLLGRSRFLALYLISAFGGSVGFQVIAGIDVLANGPMGTDWGTGTVGASGAVFGLFAATFVVSRRLGLETGGIVTLLVINGVLGFVIPGIAWQAHLGGAITGAVVALLLVLFRAPGKQGMQWASLAAVVLVLAATAVGMDIAVTNALHDYVIGHTTG